jgi:superfamily II DNA or RNA helicase
MDDLIVGTDMRTLINRGFLTEYKIYAPLNNINLDDVKITSTGEYSKVEVNDKIRGSQLIVHDESTSTGDAVEHYLKLAKGKLGITFVPSMEIGEVVTAQFNSVGVPAMLVNAKTPDNERAEIIKKFARGELLQLVNVDLFGEGFDLPAIEVVSMLRPTMSYGLYIQCFGRALRKLDGKKYGLIIDHVGNVSRHGLPDKPVVWSLDPEKNSGKRKKSEINPNKTCDKCALVYERFLPACPDCGFKPEPVERTINHVDGSLEELSPLLLAQMRGDIVLKDRPVDELVNEYVNTLNKHIKPLHAQRHINQFRLKCVENQKSQKFLREKMAMWAGWRRHEGSSDDEIFKKFFILTGIDWLTAQALESKHADVLAEAI